jgi:diguanylate cyclase (GGDEF)-like protein
VFSNLPPRPFRIVPIVLVIALGVLAAGLAGTSDNIDTYLSDLRFRAKDRAPTGNVVLVDIDAASLAEIGVWPWPRSIHGKLVSEAERLGASRLAFDVDFSASSSHAEDAAFAAALSRTPVEIFLAAFTQVSSAKSGRMLPAFAIEPLLRHSWPAAVNVPVDPDGAVRRFPFSANAGEETIASMPVVLADKGRLDGTFQIDFSIRATDLPRVSYADIINHRVPLGTFSGKTLIVGATALELRDLFFAPVHGIVSGSTLLALATETLLQGRELGFSPAPTSLLLGVGLLALIGMFLIRSWLVIPGLLGLAVTIEALALHLQVNGNTILGTASVHITLAGFCVWALARESDLRRLLLWMARTETRNTENMLNRVVEDGFDGVIILDEQDRIARINRLGLALLGLDRARGLTDLPSPMMDKIRLLRRKLRAGEIISREAQQLELAQEEIGRCVLEYTIAPFWIKQVSAGGRQHVNDACFVCLTIRDVTERKIAEERLRFLAMHDSLTGLLNRRALEERLEEVEAGSDAADQKALLSFDLDRFKAVNDVLGHSIGDKVLIEVAKRASAFFGNQVTFARVGGDEFSALITGDAAADASGMADALVSAISEPLMIQDHRICVGTSVGVLQWSSKGKSASTAMRQADVALNRAKQSGSQVTLFDPSMENDRLARLELERNLETAFESKQFAIVYQPQFSLGSEKIVGAEALLRWSHPTKGLISPALFIPVAEEMGLIHRLGDWVLTQACCDASRWPMPIKVAVNVSSLQFETGDLVGAVRDALRTSGLPAARLELEITESAFVQESRRLQGIFEQLLALGVSFALDDFGTGYSSLGYLHRFPISKIKIDRSFVTGVPKEGHAMAILRSVRALADGLSIRTIAEGVETAEQAETLRLMGCDDAQGYLYSKPINDASLTRLMMARHLSLQLAS